MNLKDFAAQMNDFQTQQNAAIDGLVQDQKTQSDRITALQTSIDNGSSDLSDADSKALSDIAANASTITQKLAALDALTPPPVPTQVQQ
jgi:uncharacterized membrane protein YccC